MLTALETAVTDAVARRADDLCDLTAQLVAFDTRSPEPGAGPREEAALQALVAERMRAAGLAVRVWEPAPDDLPPSRYPIPPGHDFRGRPQLLATARAPAAAAPCSSTATSTWSRSSRARAGRATPSRPRCATGGCTAAAPAT